MLTVAMATDDTTTVVKIDPDGDIIFELSSDQVVKTHPLISSKVLSLVSPVLGKIFEWEFRAQQSDYPSSKQRPSVIPLPEDDLEAFILLAKITHHKMDGVPENLELDCLIEFASICHKYDCVKAVTHSSLLWLRVDTADYSSEDLNKLLFAAYIPDIPDVFMRVSRIILFNHPGQFLNLPGFTDEDLSPRELLLGTFFLFFRTKEGLYFIPPVILTELKNNKNSYFQSDAHKISFRLDGSIPASNGRTTLHNMRIFQPTGHRLYPQLKTSRTMANVIPPSTGEHLNHSQKGNQGTRPPILYQET